VHRDGGSLYYYPHIGKGEEKISLDWPRDSMTKYVEFGKKTPIAVDLRKGREVFFSKKKAENHHHPWVGSEEEERHVLKSSEKRFLGKKKKSSWAPANETSGKKKNKLPAILHEKRERSFLQEEKNRGSWSSAQIPLQHRRRRLCSSGRKEAGDHHSKKVHLLRKGLITNLPTRRGKEGNGTKKKTKAGSPLLLPGS